MSPRKTLGALLLILALPACDAIHSFRRTPEGDLTQFCAAARRLLAADRNVIFDSLAGAVSCVRKEQCESFEERCAEGKGRDDFTQTQIYSLKQIDGVSKGSITILAFPLPKPGVIENIARTQLGKPTGVTTNNQFAWQVPCGVLVTDASSLRIELPSGDPHDLLEVAREPALPASDSVLQRMMATAAKGGGTMGSRGSAEKLVALMVERSPLGSEMCQGELARDGRETCVGRGLNQVTPAKLEMVQASSVIRRRGASISSASAEAISLLNDIVGPEAAQLARTAVERAGRERFTAWRGGNFAVTVTQQDELTDPWIFQHIVVWRRVALSNAIEARMREAWNAPAPKLPNM
jgi:hypothetical protein